MSLFRWEHQLFCYDWPFYKCFSFPLCRNVLTRSGYWLLITQLNCLYCTTDFLALTRADAGGGLTRERELFRDLPPPAPVTFNHWTRVFVITVNITSYKSLIVYCKYIWVLWMSSPCKIGINIMSCLFFLSNPLYLGSSTASSRLLLSVFEAPVKFLK